MDASTECLKQTLINVDAVDRVLANRIVNRAAVTPMAGHRKASAFTQQRPWENR